MGVALANIIPGAPASDVSKGTFIPSAWHDRVIKTPGIKHHVSADHPDIANGALLAHLPVLHSDAEMMCSTGQPTVIATIGSNLRRGLTFAAGPIAFTDLRINDVAGIPATFTVFAIIKGATASLNGVAQASILSNYDSGSKFFLASRAHATPGIIVGLAGASIFSWVFGSELVAGTVHPIAVTVNATSGMVRLFANTAGAPVASASGQSPVAYPNGQWFLWGQQLASVCWRGAGGDIVICHGVDLFEYAGGRFLTKLFAEAKTHYGY